MFILIDECLFESAALCDRKNSDIYCAGNLEIEYYWSPSENPAHTGYLLVATKPLESSYDR